MAPEVIVDERRRRSDEAVRRLREDSRRRIEGRRTGMSSCMLGTMVALLMFVALESRRMYWAEAAPIAAHARAEAACARFARRQGEIEAARREGIAAARDWGEMGRIGARAAQETVIARRSALEQGCDVAALAPPEPRRPAVPKGWRGRGYRCSGGGPPYE